MKKRILSVIVALSGLVLAGCGGTASEEKPSDSAAPSSEVSVNENSVAESNKTSDSTAKPSSTVEATSKIKSLTSNGPVTLSIGQSMLISNCYTLTATSGSLTSKEKLCTYVSDNEEVVKIVNKTMKAVSTGTANVTVTSSTDTTKTCILAITVKDVYFDRSLSTVAADDDFTHELSSDYPDDYYVRTSGSLTEDLFVKGVNAVDFIAETSIVYHSTGSSENYPKVGIFASTGNNTDPTDNKMYFFLDIFEPHNPANTSFANFGVCEVNNGANWAWNPGVTNTMARHLDNMYTAPSGFAAETQFKMTMVKKGLDFHFFVNDVYARSCRTLDDLFGAEVDGVLTPVASSVGFFEFNSDVTFSKYSVTTEATAVDAKIASAGELNYIGAADWAED